MYGTKRYRHITALIELANQQADATPLIEFMLSALLDALSDAMVTDQVGDQVIDQVAASIRVFGLDYIRIILYNNI
ncbi:MAG: hypothetical protein KJ804_11705 [Proteobacteria bacterium]|nr:hypothetical protein [Pseudomonadota bacterium]MBU1058970.1 hypothetical protein [Pseudomonadota bacterium]